jgi:hypothetical protein
MLSDDGRVEAATNAAAPGPALRTRGEEE